MTGDGVGTLAEETAKLLSALAAQHTDDPHVNTFQEGHACVDSPEAEESGAKSTQDSATEKSRRCAYSWCPLCYAADSIRENPDVVEQVADSAIALFTAIKQAVVHPQEEDKS